MNGRRLSGAKREHNSRYNSRARRNLKSFGFRGLSLVWTFEVDRRNPSTRELLRNCAPQKAMGSRNIPMTCRIFVLFVIVFFVKLLKAIIEKARLLVS